MLVCRLYRERLSQVNSKLAEVEAGRAAEYLEPLAVLLENMQVRTKVAGKFNTSTHSFIIRPWNIEALLTDTLCAIAELYFFIAFSHYNIDMTWNNC